MIFFLTVFLNIKLLSEHLKYLELHQNENHTVSDILTKTNSFLLYNIVGCKL